MRIGKGAKRKSARRRYLFSYCGIALVPVFIIAFALIVLFDTSHKNTAKELYIRAITQTAAHIDSIHQEMQGAAAQLTNNEYIQNLMGDRQPDARLADALLTYLRTVAESSKLPMLVAFYRVGETRLYTPEGIIPYASFEASMAREADLTMSKFFSNLNSTNSMSTWLLESGRPDGQQSKIAFTLSVSAPNASKLGTLIFIVDVQDVLAVVNSYLGVQPDYFYLYASNYSLVGIFEREPLDKGQRNELLRSGISAIRNFDIMGERYQVLRYKTNLFGMQIITGVKLETLYVDTGALRTNVLWMTLLIAALSVVAAVLLARYAYRPIRWLLRSIDPMETDEALGEFERIDHHLHAVRSEMAAMQGRLAMQRPMVRDRALAGLMRGTLDENGMEQLRVVCPDISVDKREGYVALVASEGRSLMYKLHVLEKLDLAGANAHGVFLEDLGIFALLVLPINGTDNRLEQCREILGFLGGHDLPSLRIGAGNLAQSPSAIPTSYLEAYIALNDQKSAKDSNQVFLYTPQVTPLSSDGEDWLLSGGEATGIFLQSLRSVDEKTAQAKLNTLLERIAAGHPSLLNATYTRFDLFSRTMSVCEKEVVETFRDQMSAIEIFSDIDRFRDLMTRLTAANCTAVEKRRTDALSETRRKIVNAVRAHCFDPAFSLGALSKLVDYSATYINRCLREETGYSFIQLVSMARIAKAKEELIETDDKIMDIVAKVGYLDVTSFSRKFKEAEGMTPGAYRALNRKAPNAQ